MKLCIALFVLGVVSAIGPYSVSAHIAIVAQNLFDAIRQGDLAAVAREANAGNVNALNDMGQNSLHFALRYNNVEIIEKLIEKGANVNHVDLNGRTPLQQAKGNTVIEDLLRKHGAN